MSLTCMRCGLMTECTKSSGDLLWLCLRCVVQPSCGEFHHDYHASSKEGHLICLQCGSVLISKDIVTTIVEAPKAVSYDFDC